MAEVKLLNNILSNEVQTFSVDKGLTLKKIIEVYTDGEVYFDLLIECYDLETGETFYEPAEKNNETNNVLVFVNGENKELDYEVKEYDKVVIIITPADDGNQSDGWNWWGALAGFNAGTISGMLYGLSVGGSWGLLVGGAIGGIIGFFGGGLAMGAIYDRPQQDVGLEGTGDVLTGQSLPDVRGASNQPLLNQPIPLVLGKHLTVPFISGSPWNEISGTRGETNYIHCQYLVGYTPLRLTDFKLGEMMLAHNQKWNGNENLKNIYHGAIHGTSSSSGSGEDDGEIVSTWKENDVTLEILQQRQPSSQRTINPYYQSKTQIDLSNRPLIDAPTMRSAGWTEVQDGEIATVYSIARSNAQETYTVLVTPILSDGTVLSPSQIENIADEIISGTPHPEVFLADFTGSDSIEQSDVYAEGLHEDQEYFYFGTDEVDYGSIYPYAKLQNEINADVLYIADGSLSAIDAGNNISYKGLGLKNGLRNNPIRFSEQFPKSVKVELDFKSGLYKTSPSGGSVSYSKIPLWVAVQWRVQSDENDFVSGNESGELPIPEYDYVNKCYAKIDGKVKRGWNNFPLVNNINLSKFTYSERLRDVKAHTGNEFDSSIYTDPYTVYEETTWRKSANWSVNIPEPDPSQTTGENKRAAEAYAYAHMGEVQESTYTRTISDIGYRSAYTIREDVGYNTSGGYITSVSYYAEGIRYGSHTEGSSSCNLNLGWADKMLFNLEPLGGTNSDQDGLNEIRCVAELDLIQWARENLLTEQEQDNEQILAEKIKAYFYDSTNSSRSIEVRVVRVSPNYIDEATTSGARFNDVFVWTNLTSEMLDGDKLLQENQIVQKRPLPESIMRKVAIVSLKAKTDNIDQLSSTIKKFSCISQSFNPYFDKENKVWIPNSVNPVTKYYKPTYKDNQGVWHDGEEITREQYLEDRQNGIKSLEINCGNDFVSQLVNEIRTEIDSKGRYYIPDNSNVLKYCDSNVASVFLQAALGPHLGVDALCYSQNNFSTLGYRDLNLAALGEWYEFADDVTDGSTYPSNGTHYDRWGRIWIHHEGDTVHFEMTANAYVYQTALLEQMLANIATAGRAVITRDKQNRMTVIIDKPQKYPRGVINQRNTLKTSCSLSYTGLPSGLQVLFNDENDGYAQNQLYCMVDGEDAENPKKAIEQYQIPYVTNNYQAFSLARYLLANRLMNREIVTKQVGIEGYSFSLGDTVLLQDSLMLIGTDNGARITDLIEDDDYIYGFLIDSTYKITGKTEQVLDGSGNVTLDGSGNPVLQSTQGVLIMQPNQYDQSRTITIRLALVGTEIIIDGVTYKVKKGNSNLVLFEDRIAKSDLTPSSPDFYVYKPEIGNLVGFGEMKTIAATYRIVRIKSDNKHNFEFTLLQYQDELYSYGRELPSFQNNMTVPDRSEEDSFPLTDNMTTKDIVASVVTATSQSNTALVQRAAVIPPNPRNLKGIVTKDGIEITCDVSQVDVDNISYILYRLEKYDGTYVDLKGSFKISYQFDRTIDGYPELDTLTHWGLQARTVSTYNDVDGNLIMSELVTGDLDFSSYGTWIIPSLTYNKEVVDRTLIISALYNTPSRTLYGNIETLVRVKRKGNTYPVGDRPHPTFNELLKISPDEEFYKPDFDSPVTYEESQDREGNYKLNSQDPFVSSNTKITHTVPLIGQTLRIFREDNTPILHNNQSVFSKDVEDVSVMPQSATEGTVVHYTGNDVVVQDVVIYAKGAYYLYENSDWVLVYSKAMIVPTTYIYELKMRNESGYETQPIEVEVEALCTSIADIVHSHEHYKNLFVEKLSAINANIGLIQQGGMGTFNKANGNYWALSDLSAADSGVAGGIKKGSFRVGGRDQYFLVEPDENDPEKFKIELRAGSINLTTESDQEGFVNGTYIYDGDPKTATSRLALYSTGMVAQELSNGQWKQVAKVALDPKGNLIITNSDEDLKFGIRVTGPVYHFDSQAGKDKTEGNTNPESIIVTGTVVETNPLSPILSTESSQFCINGTVTKDITLFTGKTVFFSKSDSFIVDRMIKIDGTQAPTTETYNATMKHTKDAGTVGSYLGLTSAQIINGIFTQA